MVKNQGSWARNCLLGMLALTFLCSGYIIPAARAESGDVGSLVAKVDRLGSSRYVTRVWAERSGSLELAREEAMRAIRYAAAQNSEALVSVSRTLAGDDYRERVRTLSAVGVTVRVVNEKVSMESDGRTLELIADVTVDPVSGERLRTAVEQDVQRGARLRQLEAEIARLHGVIAGLPADRSLSGPAGAKRRAALEALLQNETEIRQIFPAGSFETMLADNDAALDAAVRTFEREVLESLANTFVDARILRVERPDFALDQGQHGTSGWRELGGYLVAVTKVTWTLESPLEHYARVLGRWFEVDGAEASKRYSILPGGRPGKRSGICVGPNNPRNPFPGATALFERVKERMVQADIALWEGDPKVAKRPVAAVAGLIAGPVEFGKRWCVFALKDGAEALPTSDTPGMYSFGRGASISASLPYRLMVPSSTQGGAQLIAEVRRN